MKKPVTKEKINTAFLRNSLIASHIENNNDISEPQKQQYRQQLSDINTALTEIEDSIFKANF